MSNATLFEAGSGPITLEIERAGRRFPDIWDKPAKASVNRIQQLRTRPQEDLLPERIAESLWELLPWKRIAETGETNRDQVIAAYIDSLKRIERCRDDVSAMLRAACAAALDFRQGTGETNTAARDKAFEGKVNEVLSEASSQWMPTVNVANAELMSKPAEVYCEQLDAALVKAVREFAKQFTTVLARLVDRQIVGLVEWLPNHCCRYHFFKQVVIQHHDGRTEQILSETRFVPNERDPVTGLLIVGHRKVAHTDAGRHELRLGRHEHEVINAIRTSIGNSTVVVPTPVQPLVEAIPDWLYPCVEVIDGEIIRERIIERDIGTEDITKVEIRDEPILGCEPGIIIGPYVLAGWGPREVAQEELRRHLVVEAAQQARELRIASFQGPLLLASAAVLSAIGLWLLLGVIRGNGGHLLVALAGVAALVSTWQAAFDFGTARKNPTAALAAHFVTASIGFQLLLAGWLVARWFSPLSWVTPVVLFVLTLVSYRIARHFQ